MALSTFPTLAVSESFSGANESPLSKGGKWALVTGAFDTGETESEKWRGLHGFPEESGARWTVAEQTLPAASLQVTTLPTSERSAGLWICLSASARSGYFARWTGTGGTGFTVTIERWVAGEKTVLLTLAKQTLEAGDSIGVTRSAGSILTVWRLHEAIWAPLGQTMDPRFANGYGGIATNASASRFDNFSFGSCAESLPAPTGKAGLVASPFSYYAYDLLSGRFMGQFPMRGVQFGQQINTPGTASGTVDLQDPRVYLTNPLQSTVPNRTMVVVDYEGSLLWGGISLPRRWKVESSGNQTTRALEVSLAELWSYFQQRVQATDYSAPPFSGITGSSTPMSLWQATPWDASLIACQVIEDAIGYYDSKLQPYGDLLGGLGIALNGKTPSGSEPASPVGDYIAITYPFQSAQTVDTIVTQLSQLGLGVGFDFGVDVAYSAGPGSALIATINLAYPRRGRTVEQNSLRLDLSRARSYEIAEDGSQTANQIYEIGGQGAISVNVNPEPLEQGYPVLERVISRGSVQSANMLGEGATKGILQQFGESDLALYSYAPVTITVTIGIFDPSLPIGSFTIGDDVLLYAPQYAPNGEVFDPRMPAGLEQEWRIIAWQANVADEGDSTLKLTFSLPPFLQALAPAI